MHHSARSFASLQTDSGFERTIMYAISTGGDTDTIASMAGAIAGAYYGIEAIPRRWIEHCEGTQDAIALAEKLHALVSKPADASDKSCVSS